MTTFDILQQTFDYVGIIAQAVNSPTGQTQPWWTPLVLPIIFVGVIYFVIIRPQSLQRKELEKIVEETKIGDKVETTGGIVGIITNVRDKTFIVKTADQTKFELLKGHVTRVIRDSKETREVKEVAVSKV
ncbi:MAG: preprotein translocase subunit YajC [Candidatus Methylacidiphilales bacterium]